MSDRRYWQEAFPHLLNTADSALDQLIAESQVVTLPAENAVFHSGSACENYLLVLQGKVRVQFVTEQGREIVLYYVGAGQSCVMTTSCLLGDQSYPVEGVTESEVRALAISKHSFEHALDHSHTFRKFVFDGFSRRLAEVISRMEQVAFGSIDRRLAEVLLKDAPVSKKTHQSLATEVGSAREVVSRHLKRFEDRGWVKLRRGAIEILDPQAMSRLLS